MNPKRSDLPTYQFTKDGYESVKKEQEDLLKKRPVTVDELRTAREMGDLSENGAYKAARASLSAIDSRLRRLAILIKYAKIVDNPFTGKVDFGTNVMVDDGKKIREFQIVGDLEANPTEGKLSPSSPIGKALMGKKTGETVEIDVPAGKITFKVVEVKEGK